MKPSISDMVGIVLVAGTVTALLLHSAPGEHRDSHIGPVADAGGAVTSAESVPTIAFVDVNVISMEGDGVLRRQVVVVRDGFVTQMGAVGVVEPPSDARTIDGRGSLYLAPGLTDAHVHLGDDAERLLPLYLANGVTTVFNLEGNEQHLALKARVRSGDLVGPTIYTAGPFIDDALVRSAADARRVVRQQRARGYDFVKLHGPLASESFRALTEAGRKEGIPIVGHAPRNLSFGAVLRNGQAGVSHAEELIYTEFMTLNPRDLSGVATEMATAGTWLTPGLVTFENIAAQWGSPAGLDRALRTETSAFLPPAVRRDWAASTEYIEKDPLGRDRIEDMLAFHEPLIRTFHDAGVPMLAGTDAGLPGLVPGFSLFDEILALHGVGLSSQDALAAATRNAGLFVKQHVDVSASFGVVAAEARADFILLDQDPRTDLTALRRPLGVMARGRWYDRAALDSMLSAVPRGR